MPNGTSVFGLMTPEEEEELRIAESAQIQQGLGFEPGGSVQGPQGPIGQEGGDFVQQPIDLPEGITGLGEGAIVSGAQRAVATTPREDEAFVEIGGQMVPVGEIGRPGGQDVDFEALTRQLLLSPSPVDPTAFRQPEALQQISQLLVNAATFAAGRGAPQVDASGIPGVTPQDVEALGIAAPEIGQFATPGERTQFREQQQALIDSLLAQARGETGPSAAELQLQAGTEAAIRAARAQAASQPGVSAAQALRGIQQATTQATLAEGQEAARIRAQEQAAAQALAAQTLAGARAQDIGTRAQELGLRAQDIGVGVEQARLGFGAQELTSEQALRAALANQEAQLRAGLAGQELGGRFALADVQAQLEAQRLRDQLFLGGLGQAAGVEQFGALGQRELQGLRVDELLGRLGSARAGFGAEQAAETARRQQNLQVLGALLAAGGTVGAGALAGA